MIKLIIVDDEKLIREGIKILLSVYQDIEVVGMCESGNAAYQFCKSNDVDVALMDIRMEDGDGVTATQMIAGLNKNIKVLILTTFTDIEYIKQAMHYGASGYLLKDSSSEKLYSAIKSTYKGNVVLTPEMLDKIMNNSQKEPTDISKYGLLKREIETITLIAQGLSNKEIGEQLFLAEGTIKNHVSNILSKLELRDRTQIAIFAYKNNLA